MIIDNNGNLGGYTIAPAGYSDVFGTVTAKNGGYFRLAPTATLDIATLVADVNGIVEFDSYTTTTKSVLSDIHVKSGGTLRHTDNSTSQSHIANIIADDITIDGGGIIGADGLGYDAPQGPGAASGNSGGGYGGVGANGTTGTGGTDYGNMLQPFDLGSGAGSGGAGGGALRLQANGTFTVNGQIRSEGAAGGSNQGGGSGGSILLTANNLVGDGFITANGGNGVGNGGGGAGGRIAIYYFNQTFLPDGGHITSAVPGDYTDPVGGTGFATGADGTLYLAFPDHYEILGNATQEAGDSQTITISLIDNFGNAFVWDGTRNVVLTGAGSAATGNPSTCTDRLGNAVPFDSPMALDFVNGVAVCDMVIYKAGTFEIEVDDGSYDSLGNPAWDLDVTVTGSTGSGGGGAQPSILYSRLSADKKVAFISETVTATLSVYDDYGNPMTTGGETVVIAISGANPGTPAVTDNGDGTYTASYVASNAGNDRITATLNGNQVMDDTDGVPDGIFNVSVLTAPADHLEVLGASTQYAGSAQTITIRAATPGGIADAAYEGVKTITLSGANPSPEGHRPTCRDRTGTDILFGSPMDLEFVNGEATCQMYLYRVESAEIDATDGTFDSTGDPSWDLDVAVTINPASAIQGRIHAAPAPAVDGDTVAVSVQATDYYGNDWNRTGLSVTLSITGANTVAPAVTDNGDGTYSASYSAFNVGADEIRGTVSGFIIAYDTELPSDGVFHLTVLASVLPQRFEVTGSPTQVAGTWQDISITAKDNAGTLAASYRGQKTVTISGPQPSFTGQPPTCRDRNGVDIPVGSPMALDFTNGVATCRLYLYKAGSTEVDATDGSISSFGDPAWDLDVTVTGGSLDNTKSFLWGSSTNVNTKDTVSLVVYARDTYGNDIPSAGHTVALTVSGANAKTLSVADNGNGTYSASYVARNAGNDAVSGTFNAAVIAADNDGVSDGTFRLSIADTVTANHLEVTGSPTQVAGSAQMITITAKDADGYRDFGYLGTKTVKLSGANRTASGFKPACFDKTGVAKPFGASTVLDFVQGQAQCLMILYHVETAHIDAEDGTLNSYGHPDWDLDVTVLAQNVDVSGGVIDAQPNPIVVGGTVQVTMTMRDPFGSPVYDPALTIDLFVSGANPQTLSFTDNADGTYTASYVAENHGTDLIEGTVDGEPIPSDTDGISDGTYYLQIVPLNGTIGASPSPALVGDQVTVTVELDAPEATAVDMIGWEVLLDIKGANPQSLTTTDNNDGTYTATYTASNKGIDFITGTIAGSPITADTDGVSDGTFQLAVVEPPGSGATNFISGYASYAGLEERPAAGVEVTDGVRSAMTDPFGYYFLTNVPNGTYTVRGYRPGYSVKVVDNTNPVVINNNSATNVNLLLSNEMPVEVFAPWNGFLGNIVIAEVFNTGSEPLTAQVSLYNLSGGGTGGDPSTLQVRIPSQQQRDIILNDMEGFQRDSYGIVKLNFSHTDYSGQVSYYKVKSGEVGFDLIDEVKDEFDYALANPFVATKNGTTYVGFNTMQPSERPEDQRKLVPNWLTIVNAEPEKKLVITIKKYDASGTLLGAPPAVGTVGCKPTEDAMRCSVPAMGRIDIDGGHVHPGPNRTGLIEIVPDDPNAEYVANLIRYGTDAPPEVYTENYNFAVHLQAREGTHRAQIMPVSTGGGAETWLELINTASEDTVVTAEFFFNSGEYAGQQLFTLAPKAQRHVPVAPILGANATGVVKLTASTRDSLVAQALSYYRSPDRSLYAVYAIQAKEPMNAVLAGTYNRYLGLYNWLRVANLENMPKNVTVRIYTTGDPQEVTYQIAPYGGLELPLHDTDRFGIDLNTLGMFEVENPTPGGIFAELLRVKPADTVPFDFIMSTSVR